MPAAKPPEDACVGDGKRNSQTRVSVFREGEHLPKIAFRCVHEMAAQGFPVAVTCRVVGVSRSRFYDWVGRVPSARSVRDAEILDMIQWSHERSRGTYGAQRVHVDLTMERGVSCGKKRGARLMRSAGIRGVCHQRKRRGWKPLPAPHDDLVKRQFTASGPDRVWFCDVTQHRAPVTIARVGHCVLSLLR